MYEYALDRNLSGPDLEFVASNGTDLPPGREELQRLLIEDETFRSSVLGSDVLFDRMMASDESLALVSSRLFFEVLLRRAVKDLRNSGHTVERTGGHRLPVFDTDSVVKLAESPPVLHYLAGMLSSFTHVESYTHRVFVRRGIVRRVRYSDLDIHSMLRLAQDTDEAQRLPVYKRIADLCLLVLGIFPDFAATANRYPGTGALRQRSAVRPRLNTEEYEALAQEMYSLAAEHPSALEDQAEVFRTLGGRIIEAKKPLNFVSEHYLGFKRQRLFDVG
ncbi:MAG: hypothetical protein WD645_03435 [Dehalococcoidia bacterium]